MALSESAEKGRRTAAIAALFCNIGAALSLLTLDIPLALIGFWVSGGIRKGNTAARNMCILLRAADIFFLLIILFAVKMAGVPEWLDILLIAAAGLMAFIDIWLLIMLTGNKGLKQYFSEMSEAESKQNH